MAGKKERQRRIAREKYRRQQEARRARREVIRKRALTITSAVAVLGLALGLVLAFALPGNGKPAASPSATHSASPSPTASASTTTVTEPATHCAYSITSAAQTAKKETFPPATPDFKTVSYLATIHTNLGPLTVKLLNSKATCTVNSFVHLARAGYFNNTQCHRMVTTGIYVLQCGDAFATASTKLTCAATSKIGSGGPGYQFANENTNGATYPAATVAMANAGAGTNGSQFFIVFKNTSLPANYTPFGTVSSGLNIVQNVAKDGLSCTYGSPGDGAPKQKVIIDSVTIQKT
ncbi:MAG TPA: peptidylprolyl isomerase [Streptosporangiaceae bacterium]|nr:peptidylprolyl isomerase [Streptosporangiaceae bacterium]